MKRLTAIIAVLLCLGSMAFAQNVGNCTYEPLLDEPQHSPVRLSIIFEDYESIRLADAESGVICIYRTSLEKEYETASPYALTHYAYREAMRFSGNKLTFYPTAYRTPGVSQVRPKAPVHKAWGTDTQDYLRVDIPAGTFVATDAEGKEWELDAISYQYVYTDEEVEDDLDPLEYVLTPEDGETVKTLSSFTLEFPYCRGLFALNYDQPENPYVLDEQGQVVTTGTRSYDYSARNTGLIALKNSISKAGVYTLVIPEASYHLSSSLEAYNDSLYHPEICATYTVLGSDERMWESLPADGSTVATFDGIHITFTGKTIVSKNPNVGNGVLKVFNKDDDKYAAMEFQNYFATTGGGTINFTTASQISKVKDKTTYYLDLPYGLLNFSDGSVNDGLHLEFTYDTEYAETPVDPVEPEDPDTPDTPEGPDTPDNPDTPDTPDAPELVMADNYVGYTTAAVTRTNGVRFNSGEEQGMLIYLPKEKTALLAGATIKAIRTATGTTQLDSPRLIIIEGDDINQTPVVEQATGKFSTSMKDYALDTPYVIQGDKALFVGYKCSLSAAYKPMLFDGTLDLPAGLAWAITDQGWEDISGRGYGAPNIQVQIDRNIDAPDVLVKPFHTSTYNKVGDDMSIHTQVFNYGLQEVKSFDITYKIGQDEAVVKSIKGVSLPQGSTYDVSINDATIASSGRLPLTIGVTNVNGAADADGVDNQQTCSMFVYPADMNKKVLFEEFTGQTCINCPSGMATVNSVLSAYEGQVVEVYHHAGYAPDNFTTLEDSEYTWFFNNGGNTYAPAGMANRHPALPSQTTAVIQSNVRGDVQAVVQSAMQVAPCVGITMQNDYDDQARKGKVSIDVTCYEMPSDRDHRLNVWLVQDSVSRYQNGTGIISHNHAMRMSLTGVWGQAIQLTEGETSRLTFDYEIPGAITGKYATYVISASGREGDDKVIQALPEHMRIVAFVSDHSENALNCTVWNVEECDITDVPSVSTGLVTVAEGGGQPTGIYDLQGRHVEKPRHGLYITHGKTILKR